jgi:hypothetical protein
VPPGPSKRSRNRRAALRESGILDESILSVNGVSTDELTALEGREVFRAPKTVIRARVEGVERTVTVAAAAVR